MLLAFPTSATIPAMSGDATLAPQASTQPLHPEPSKAQMVPPHGDHRPPTPRPSAYDDQSRDHGGLSPIAVARHLGHGKTRMTLDRCGHGGAIKRRQQPSLSVASANVNAADPQNRR